MYTFVIPLSSQKNIFKIVRTMLSNYMLETLLVKPSAVLKNVNSIVCLLVTEKILRKYELIYTA